MIVNWSNGGQFQADFGLSMWSWSTGAIDTEFPSVDYTPPETRAEYTIRSKRPEFTVDSFRPEYTLRKA